jgi:energy-coupling factor transporter ATP-binding protein EcfA2
VEVFPKFKVGHTEDLMIRGGKFYAIWNEDAGLWTTDETVAWKLIDRELDIYAEKMRAENPEVDIKVMHLWDSDTGSVDKWHKYIERQMIDIYEPLDTNVTFADAVVGKSDHVSKKLPYSIGDYDIWAYEELLSTLYDPEERKKLEWAIGSIFAGDSKRIQKFVVLFGDSGSGKSTVLHIIEQLFDGYHSFFSSKVLGSANNDFALESFKNNPLVAIEHDGDLSRIEDNTRLNSIVSHEYMEINVKFGNKYISKFDSFLFIGTNRPVKITDAKSGIIRRLIDVKPSGRKVVYSKYCELVDQIRFELGGIAKKCLDLYYDLGEDYYNHYIPQEMISATNDFYNFVENYFDEFSKADGVTLKDAWTYYKEYCDYASVPYPYSMRIVKSELKNYFSEFKDQAIVEGNHYRNYYSGFLKDKFDYDKKESVNEVISRNTWLDFEEQRSIFDVECCLCPAQYAGENETPLKKWENVTTRLKDINTGLVHYVQVPDNHIVIDFDIKDENGNKSYQKNLEAASKWPKTYAELSKSGGGIHLHYIYDGDVTQLKRLYDDDIEIKVFTGNQSLRRRLTKCNNLQIRTISSGLPLKGADKVVNFETIKNEKAIRTIIKNCLDKKHHGATKPEVDYIYATLEDAYKSGIVYDVTDLRPKVLAFANNSSHQADKCLELVSKMHFCSEVENTVVKKGDDDKPIAFYDVEVFPNLFVICWKVLDDDICYKRINPSVSDVVELISDYRLVGFNCRRYDNHILYAKILGYSNEELFNLSQKIINKQSVNAFFVEAYNISYTDIYDFTSKKQSLKKWEIELGIHHQELGLPWDKPVPEELWDKVAEYCINDVVATEAVWKKNHTDFVGREILADLSGLTVNHTNRQHITRILFGDNKTPPLVYTNLATGEQSIGR